MQIILPVFSELNRVKHSSTLTRTVTCRVKVTDLIKNYICTWGRSAAVFITGTQSSSPISFPESSPGSSSALLCFFSCLSFSSLCHCYFLITHMPLLCFCFLFFVSLHLLSVTLLPVRLLNHQRCVCMCSHHTCLQGHNPGHLIQHTLLMCFILLNARTHPYQL